MATVPIASSPTPSPEPAPSDTLRSAQDWWYLVLLVGVFAGAAAVSLYWLNRHWFYFDEWAYLDPTIEGADRSAIGWLFTPHGGHTIVWTRLWFQLMLQLDGLHHYLLYGIPSVVAHLSVGASVLVIVRRLTGSRWLALGAASCALMNGAGEVNMLWAGQFQFVLPVALFLGWIALDVAERLPVNELRLTVLALLVGVVGSLSSLVFLPLAVCLAAFLGSTRRWGAAAAVVGAPAGIFLISAVVFGRQGGTGPSAGSAGQYLGDIGSYVLLGLAAPFGGTLRSASAGYAVLAVTLAGLALVARDAQRLRVALTLIGSAVLFLLVTGYGRMALGLEQATVSRYAYIVLTVLTPVWGLELAGFVALFSGSRRVVASVVSVAWLVLFATLGGWLLWVKGESTARRDAESRGIVVAAAREAATFQRPASLGRPEPRLAPQLTVGTLLGWYHAGKLPDVAAGPRLRAQALVNLYWPERAGADAALVSCVPLGRNAHLDITSPSSTSVSSDAAASVLITSLDQRRPASAVRSLTFPGAYTLDPVPDRATAIRVLNQGPAPVTVCR